MTLAQLTGTDLAHNTESMGVTEMASLPLVATVWRNKLCFLLRFLLPQGLSGGSYASWPLVNQPSVLIWRLSWQDRILSSLRDSLQCKAMCVQLRSTGNLEASVERSDQGYFSSPIWSLPIWRLAGLAFHQLPSFRCLEYGGFWKAEFLGNGFSQDLTGTPENRERLIWTWRRQKLCFLLVVNGGFYNL